MRWHASLESYIKKRGQDSNFSLSADSLAASVRDVDGRISLVLERRMEKLMKAVLVVGDGVASDDAFEDSMPRETFAKAGAGRP